MAESKKRLDRLQVLALARQLISGGQIDEEKLLAFAVAINRGPFPEPKVAKAKPLTMAEAKKAVLLKFACKTVAELRKNKNFEMSMTGEEFSLKSKDDWVKLYRRWVSVPATERDQVGPTCINGIDVLENFRPWHVFGLDPDTASQEDVKIAFRELVKVHHPDAGGDPRVFERLQKMKESVLALMR
jgi:hypothetical protein